MTIEILLEDAFLIACLKPAGVLSEQQMPALLKEQTGYAGEYFVLHRLDREVSGVMLFAKSKFAAAALSAQIADRKLQKEYLAVVHGAPAQNTGVLEDFLFKDSKRNKSFVVKRQRKGVKAAALSYVVLGQKQDLSLVKIRLHTGRTHQIRVQFSARQMPLYGDKKYGGHDNAPIALFSHKIVCAHPKTGEMLSFHALPPAVFPWDLFDIKESINNETC